MASQPTCWTLVQVRVVPFCPSPSAFILNIPRDSVGTGIWALQFAEKHPDSNVIATDLSLIQPDVGLPNIKFFREDTEKDEWIFDVDFDYIHLRAMCVLKLKLIENLRADQCA